MPTVVGVIRAHGVAVDSFLLYVGLVTFLQEDVTMNLTYKPYTLTSHRLPPWLAPVHLQTGDVATCSFFDILVAFLEHTHRNTIDRPVYASYALNEGVH